MRTSEKSRTRKWAARAGAIGAAMALVPVMGVGTAHAAGRWTVGLSVHPNGAADMTVTDTLNAGTTYIITLTAAGGGTCTLLAGTAEVTGVGDSIGAGTVSTSTYGTCNLYDATVNYLMTWTTIGGGGGQLPVQCVWALASAPICTPKGLSGSHVSGVVD